jgi:hypothetical protein
MAKERTEGPTNMKLEQPWNGLHLEVDNDEINYNVAGSPFSPSDEKTYTKYSTKFYSKTNTFIKQ